MSLRSRSLPTTSASSFARASGVSTALSNSKSSVEARFTTAGFFGASGFGSGLGSGFATGAGGGGGGAGFTTGAGGGGGGAAGAGLGAGFSGSVAQAPMKARAATIRTSFWVFILSPEKFLSSETARFKHKPLPSYKLFLEGKPVLA